MSIKCLYFGHIYYLMILWKSYFLWFSQWFFSLVISYRTSNFDAKMKNMDIFIGITHVFFTLSISLLPPPLSFNLKSSVKREWVMNANCIHWIPNGTSTPTLDALTLVKQKDRPKWSTRYVLRLQPALAWSSRLKCLPGAQYTSPHKRWGESKKKISATEQSDIDPSTENSIFWPCGSSSLELLLSKDEGMRMKGLDRG